MRPNGTLNPANPFSFIRTVTVGFGIRPNLLTRSQKKLRRSRARTFSLSDPVPTAGGEFRPALRTVNVSGKSNERRVEPENAYATDFTEGFREIR